MSSRRVPDILRRCEGELRQVLQQAAESGEYDRVLEIGRWARNVAGLAAEAEDALSETGENGRPSGISSPQTDDAGISAAPAKAATKKKQSRRASGTKKNPTRRKAGGYPRFARQGDQLVKIGWSKKQKKEYQHKSPKHVAELLGKALLNDGADSRIVTADDLFPLHESDGSEIPSYQAYLCLAWLKAEGVVQQEGRQGYRATNLSKLPEILAAKWAALTEI